MVGTGGMIYDLISTRPPVEIGGVEDDSHPKVEGPKVSGFINKHGCF